MFFMARRICLNISRTESAESTEDTAKAFCRADMTRDEEGA
jgi:hypothetical protein